MRPCHEKRILAVIINKFLSLLIFLSIYILIRFSSDLLLSQTFLDKLFSFILLFFQVLHQSIHIIIVVLFCFLHLGMISLLSFIMLSNSIIQLIHVKPLHFSIVIQRRVVLNFNIFYKIFFPKSKNYYSLR